MMEVGDENTWFTECLRKVNDGSWRRKYVVYRMLTNYQYSDAYLKTLLQELLEHYKLSKADIYRMLFGTELEAFNNLNRPLSKLKRDILTEIGILKDGKF